MSGLYGGSPSQSGYRRDNTNAGGIPQPPAGLGGRFPPILLEASAVQTLSNNKTSETFLGVVVVEDQTQAPLQE